MSNASHVFSAKFHRPERRISKPNATPRPVLAHRVGKAASPMAASAGSRKAKGVPGLENCLFAAVRRTLAQRRACRFRKLFPLVRMISAITRARTNGSVQAVDLRIRHGQVVVGYWQ